VPETHGSRIAAFSTAAAVAVAAAIGAMGLAALAAGLTAPDARAGNRPFHEALDDTLSDFEFDLKADAVKGMKDISIRNLATSEKVPNSFRDQLAPLITERIIRSTKARVLQCLACKARKTSIKRDKKGEDRFVISTPGADPDTLKELAKANGIRHFMDGVFTYQPTGIVLSLTIYDIEQGMVVWTKSYNSETSRAAARRRGFDLTHVEGVRRVTEYTPSLQYRASISYLFEPNIEGTSGCLAFGFRMSERYANRKNEIGFEIDYFKDSSTLLHTPTSTGGTANNLYSGFNATMLFVHAWNLIGDEEDFNRVRANLTASVGGTYTAGFLGALVRGTWEWRLGKHFAVNVVAGYRPASSAFLSSEGKSVSGIEGGAGINLLF
jgi:hypothetical protein